MMSPFFKCDQYVKDPISKIKYPISASSSSRSSSSSSRERFRFSHPPTIMHQTGQVINHIGNPNFFVSEQDYEIHQTPHHGYNPIYSSLAYAGAETNYTRILNPPPGSLLPITHCYTSPSMPSVQSTASSSYPPSPSTLPKHYEYVPTKPTASNHHNQTFTDIDYVKKLHFALSGSESGPSAFTAGLDLLSPTGSKTAVGSPDDDENELKALRDDLSKLKTKIDHHEQAELHAKIRAEGIEQGKKAILSHPQIREQLDSSSSEYDSSDSDSYYSPSGLGKFTRRPRGRKIVHELIFSLPFPPPPPHSHTIREGFVAAGGGTSGGVSIYPSSSHSHSRSRSYTRIREIHNDDKTDEMLRMSGGNVERDHRRMIMEKAQTLMEDEIRKDGRRGEIVGAYRVPY